MYSLFTFLLWIYLKNSRYFKYFNIFNRCCSSEPLHSKCKKTDVECTLKQWLRFAADRDGGRQQREQEATVTNILFYLLQTETVDDSRENRRQQLQTFSFICCRQRRWTTAERTGGNSYKHLVLFAADRDGGRQQREQEATVTNI